MMFIGAEIFIEPGQTEADIYGWFKTMKEQGLGLTRIRMFENYMRNGEVWDFSLFDIAFRAAEKYEIKIYANLFPETTFSDVGGFKFPKSEENLHAIANYIKHTVEHFAQYHSLYGWVPINEPGAGELPNDDFTADRFREWKDNERQASYNSKGFTTFKFFEQKFLLAYNTWFLKWLTQEIKKYDPNRPIHVNNHDIFKNAAEYDFPSWREFLTSLGGSAHASWHFDYFSPERFSVAMSANAEMLRSGAGPLPWYMTELQGGNNTYSGKRPICPTANEIAQWLWINIGSGSRGGMFWCLNARKSGFEAGEWAMLDYLNEPTDRLIMASKVSAVLAAKPHFQEGMQVVDSGISVLYTRESLWIEQALQIKGVELEGRMVGGVMKSALSYFEALSEMGVHAAFKEIGEYNFNLENFRGKVIVLSHQISIPSKYWQLLNQFVAKGGKLIVDGLTAYYDENAYCILGADFPLRSSFGAVVKEYKTVDSPFDIHVGEVHLRTNLWKGLLKPDANATSISTGISPCESVEVFGCRNTFGEGEVVWIPSMVGLGSRVDGDFDGLSTFLRKELATYIPKLPVSFKYNQCGMLMKMICNGDRYWMIIINKSGKKQHLALQTKDLIFSRIIFRCSEVSTVVDDTVTIDNEETLVVEWTMKM